MTPLMVALLIAFGVVIVALVVAVFVLKSHQNAIVSRALDAYALEVHRKILDAAAGKKAEAAQKSAAAVNDIPELSDPALEEKINK